MRSSARPAPLYRHPPPCEALTRAILLARGSSHPLERNGRAGLCHRRLGLLDLLLCLRQPLLGLRPLRPGLRVLEGPLGLLQAPRCPCKGAAGVGAGGAVAARRRDRRVGGRWRAARRLRTTCVGGDSGNVRAAVRRVRDTIAVTDPGAAAGSRGSTGARAGSGRRRRNRGRRRRRSRGTPSGRCCRSARRRLFPGRCRLRS